MFVGEEIYGKNWNSTFKKGEAMFVEDIRSDFERQEREARRLKEEALVHGIVALALIFAVLVLVGVLA